MKRTKKSIQQRVIIGLLTLWLVFMGFFTLWQTNMTRKELLNEKYQLFSQQMGNIVSAYGEYYEDEPMSGLVLEVDYTSQISARITNLLNGTKCYGEMELACYDEYGQLIANSGPYMVFDYYVAPVGHRRYGESYYGILDPEAALPEEAAKMLIEYASFYPEEISDEVGSLNGYVITIAGLWSDGKNIVPKSIVVWENRVNEDGEFRFSPAFDEQGNLIDTGNVEIVWVYHNEPPEEMIADMVYCGDEAFNFTALFGWPSLAQQYPEYLEQVQNADEVNRIRQEGLMSHQDLFKTYQQGQMIASNGLLTTEYYYQCQESLYWMFSETYPNLTNMNFPFSGPALVAAGRIYPLRESVGIIGMTALGSLGLLSLVAFILIWQLGTVYDRQAALEAQRRRTTNAIAHDLKTPMAAITGYAENLMENTNPEKQDRYIRSIYTQVGRMNETVKGILELSRLEAQADILNLMELSLGELCRQVAESYEETVFQISGDAVILADREMLDRVLDNLFSNAARHTAGPVQISLEKGKCTVYNPGEPVPEAELPRIWEAYYQTDESRSSGGSGLGLSIVREILLRHGFDYGAENRGEGVAFWFKF